MDTMQDTKGKIEVMKKEIAAAELMINAEIGKASRENREVDPRILDAIDKVEKTKELVETLSATLDSINKLFVREVKTE